MSMTLLYFIKEGDTMYQEIQNRCKEILKQCENTSDLLEIARLFYITALIDAGVIPPNKKDPT